KSFITRSYREYVAEIGVSPNEGSISFQLWAYYWDNFDTILIAPDGSSFGPLNRQNSLIRYDLGDTQILSFRGTASPGSVLQEVYYDLIPKNTYISQGVWKLLIRTEKIKAGRIDIWMQSATNLNFNTGFVRPSPDMTITVPATASSVISVGAYNQRSNTYAIFSGRGIEEPGFWNVFKPDISAPGVDVAVKPGRFVTGTSFAVAFVTGGAALLMEWGIVRGNDLFLYGQKVKATLIDKALPLPGESVPSDKIGWGKVCIIT
ncbi:MAG: S8 family serine peptidase, partial [Lachnospira sp.]